MIVQLDGVQTGLGRWFLGSLTGAVVVFVLKLHNGGSVAQGLEHWSRKTPYWATALLGVEVNLKPLLPAVWLGHWAIVD